MTPQPPPGTRFFRVLHDAEQGLADWRIGMPEVYVCQPDQMLSINDRWQLLTYALFRSGASGLSQDVAKQKWRALYDHDGGLCNKSHGYDYGVPLRDIINGRDMSAPPPDWDKVRLFGGQTVAGKQVGDVVQIVTLTHGIVPELAELLDQPWFYARAVYKLKGGGVSDYPLGMGNPVLTPLVSVSGIVTYPLSLVEPVDEIADPYWID